MTVEGILRFQTPQEFISELKKGGTTNLQKIFDDAIQNIQKQNEEILKRNAAKPWYIHFLNFITCGSINFFEKEHSLKFIAEEINQIKNEIFRTVPEIEQVWREDYEDIKLKEQALEAHKSICASKIQRTWRCHFRRKLNKNKQTYESWKADAIVNKHSDPITAASRLMHAFKPTHYTFTHGQSIFSTVITATINCLTERFKPESVRPALIHFRIPGSLPNHPNVSKFLEKNPKFEDSQPEISAQLLSVDAFINSTEYTNSAFYYYRFNTYCFHQSFPSEPIKGLVPEEFIANRYIERIKNIANAQKSNIGSLYVLLIPKKTQENPETKIAYTSIAFGTPYYDQSIEYLERHQAEHCNSYTQFRILLNGLSLYPGIRVYRKNHLTNAENENIRTSVMAETDLLYAYSILLNLKAPITKEDLQIVKAIFIQHSDKLDKETVNYLKNKVGAFLEGTFLSNTEVKV